MKARLERRVIVAQASVPAVPDFAGTEACATGEDGTVAAFVRTPEDRCAHAHRYGPNGGDADITGLETRATRESHGEQNARQEPHGEAGP